MKREKKPEPHRSEPINNLYAILDPRKPGGRYGRFKLENEPFYVGRTCTLERRREHHLLQDSAHASRFKQSIIDKIYAAGLRPVFRILKSKLTIDEANALESKLIQLIGRRDQKLGPLTNLTDGGDGGTGRVVTKQQRLHIRKLNQDRWLPLHLEAIASWQSVFAYLDSYNGKHNPARYTCSVHGEVMHISREVERSIEAQRAPCPECGKLLRKINVGRGIRGEDLLRTTPRTHRSVMKKVIVYLDGK